jgi:hypothetical protein
LNKSSLNMGRFLDGFRKYEKKRISSFALP